MDHNPLAVFVGTNGLTASMGEKAGRPVAMLKEPANGSCPLFIFADSVDHLQRICSAINQGDERCESGDPECGPVEFHDSEGVPLCKTCWEGLAIDGACEA